MVVIEPNAENTQGYVLHIQAALINVSDRIIIVRRSLSPAPAIFPDTFLIATYKDQALQVPLCCVDGFRYVDNNYFLPLYPGESKSYSWESYLPRFTENSQGQSVDLAGKTIEVYEGYGNQEIGYAIQDQNTLGYMMSYDSTGQPVFYVADMNMWVGELESNHITFSLPN